MIRVLHVIGAMDRGGAETIIMNLYRRMDRTKIQFDFMVHENRECDYDTEITGLGGKIYRVPRFNIANSFAYAHAFRSFFSSHTEHQIVHGHIGSSSAIYLSEAKRANRFTIAHSHNQNFPLSPTELAFRALTFPTRYIADYLMACSASAGTDRFGRQFLRTAHSSILRNGIDLDSYKLNPTVRAATRESLGLGTSPTIIHVGRLAPQKNHAFLLDIFTEVRRQVPDSQLLCIGRGPLEQDVRGQARSLGLDDAVNFLGVRDDVPELLSAADLFVLPSVREGLPLAAVEAQASGLPTILSTGVPEESVISSTAERMDLSAGPTAWAQRCIDLMLHEQPRHDHTVEVRQAGFDICEVAGWLTEFYASIAQATR